MKFYLFFDVDICNSTLNLIVSNGDNVYGSFSYSTSGCKNITLHENGSLQFIWNMSSMNCCWSVSNIEIDGQLPSHHLCPINYTNCNINDTEYRCCYGYNNDIKAISSNYTSPFLKLCSPVSSKITPSTTNNEFTVMESRTFIITLTQASRSAVTNVNTRSGFMSLTSPSPTSCKCPEDKGQPETSGDKNATGVYCYRRGINGIIQI